MHHVFQPFPIEDLDFNPFKKFRDEGAALVIKDTAHKRINATYIKYGTVGNLYDRNVAALYLRKSTYTSELMKNEEYVTINFFDMDIKGIRSSLKFLEMASGRDEDKIKQLGMHIDADGDAPYLDEANFVIVCRIIACMDLNESSLLVDEDVKKLQEEELVIFITEIVNAFAR
jgi:flavin reductase (DIM6/NTAB) family NADH-FMN oxidoreductase RutF